VKNPALPALHVAVKNLPLGYAASPRFSDSGKADGRQTRSNSVPSGFPVIRPKFKELGYLLFAL
jgi:hypothetical protein